MHHLFYLYNILDFQSGCFMDSSKNHKESFYKGSIWDDVDLDYEKLLERAREGLEDVMENSERFTPPVPEVLKEVEPYF